MPPILHIPNGWLSVKNKTNMNKIIGAGTNYKIKNTAQ